VQIVVIQIVQSPYKILSNLYSFDLEYLTLFIMGSSNSRTRQNLDLGATVETPQIYNKLVWLRFLAKESNNIDWECEVVGLYLQIFF
jgi:hypothetical protein